MDPYDEFPRIPRPRDRIRDPRDPREPYTKKYTTLLSIPEPLPSMGSFDFRRGIFDDRPMTVQEQNFEQYGNNRQAEHDISSAIKEWQRSKAHEEDAIQLWQELDGNLEEYQRQMRTRDQQAMEHQCQRKKEKALALQQRAEWLRNYEQGCLNAATCKAFQEAVRRRAMEQGSPSLPTKQPIDNTGESARTSPRQPPALPQSSQNSSTSASPPRSSSVDNSTPPSSKHPSPPESPKPSPPKTPTPSRFVPDPAIWGASIAADSSYHPSQSPSLGPSPQLQSLNPSRTNTPNVPSYHPYLRGMTRINSMRYQRPQPLPTSSTNEPTPREQSNRDVPIDPRIRHILEMRKKLGRGSGDSFVTLIMGDPAEGRIGPW